MVGERKVGLLGGTFDPIHIAHLIVAEECRSNLSLDRVFFVPAGIPPHKLNNPITSAEHRVAMVELAIASNPHFEVSRLDIDRSGPCYSTDTIGLLSHQLPDSAEIYFIIGTDSLLDMPTWHEPARLIELCRFAVVGRPGYTVDMDYLESVLPGVQSRVEFVNAPSINLSSTDIKRRIQSGHSVKYQVPEQVEEYIFDQRLY
jgi:nicotinate-nucleotide adenylyltransferase